MMRKRWILACMLAAAGPAAADDLRLVEAVKRGSDPAVIRLLIEAAAPVNAIEADGATALAWAAHRDDLAAADLLLRAGADPKLANTYGVTPLALACVNRSAAMVGALLEAGADPNQTRWTGETALHSCARTGTAEAVRLLLNRGAKVNAIEERQGHTALMRAVVGKHPDVVRALLDAGADVHVRSKGGFTALLFAAQEGDLESTRLLLAAGARVNEETKRGPDARRDLVGGECILNIPNDPPCFVPAENPSPLIMAAASGHEAVALLLLEHGADPRAADLYGWTAVHHAIPEGWNAMSGFLFRPFHDPIRRPNMPALVDALLARGANPNARVIRRFSRLAMFTFRENNPVGGTPLVLAAAAGDVGIMRRLLDAGADLALTLQDGTTALMLAAGAKRLADGASQEHSPREAARALEAVKLLVALGADVNAPDASGQTALHHAASIRADGIIRFLAARGAHLDAKDRRGLTPYEVAAGAGQPAGAARHQSTMALLLELGASPPSGVK
jgi:ankyrin repeat protein